MRRSLLPALFVSALVVVLAGCTVGPTGNALDYDGHTISNSSFRRELQALRDNKAFTASLKSQVTVAATPGTINSQVAAAWLGQLAQQEAIDREASRRGIHPTAADRQAATAQGAGLFGTPQIFAAFPKWFRDRVIERVTRQIALLRVLTPAPTEADARAYFARNAAQLCPSGKLVSHVLVRTKPEADAIEVQLRQGADFAALARSQSIDPSAAQQGGSLGCLGAQQFVPEFESAARTLAVGQVSAPVQTQYGFHVIKVVAYTFDTAGADIQRALVGQAQQRVRGIIDADLAKAHVKIDRRYGRWGRTAGGGLGVVPPAPPRVREKPAPKPTAAPGGLPQAPPGPAPQQPQP